MARKKIRIPEDKLRSIVYESVRHALKESGDDNAPNVNDIDISQIDIEVLKWAYRDLRLTPTTVSYGDVLSKPMAIKEAQGDIMPPDNVVNKIIQRYHLGPQLVFKVEAHHKIYIYVITAVIGINDKLIEILKHFAEELELIYIINIHLLFQNVMKLSKITNSSINYL